MPNLEIIPQLYKTTSPQPLQATYEWQLRLMLRSSLKTFRQIPDRAEYFVLRF